jgi:hypothetical protein
VADPDWSRRVTAPGLRDAVSFHAIPPDAL